MTMELKTRKIIDWLAVTSHDIEHALDYLPEGIGLGKKTNPVKHYSNRFETVPAGILSIADTAKQGFMWQATGDDCSKIREGGISMYHVLVHFQSLRMHPTRIDYAVDIFSDVNPRDLKQHWDWGVAESTIRKEPLEMAQAGEGYTCYFGAKTGDKYVRVYDKAAQLKLLNEAWIRVEYQVRKKNAVAFGQDLELDGLHQAGDAAIKRLIDFPFCDWWQSAVSENASDYTRIPRKEEKWQAWLNGQVMQAIERRASESEVNKEWLKDWNLRVINALYGDNGTSDNGIYAKGQK